MKEDEETKLLVEQISKDENKKHKQLFDQLKESKERSKGNNNSISKKKKNSNSKASKNANQSFASMEPIDSYKNSNESFIDHSDLFLQRKRERKKELWLLRNEKMNQEVDLYKNNKTLQIKLNTENNDFKNEFIYAVGINIV